MRVGLQCSSLGRKGSAAKQARLERPLRTSDVPYLARRCASRRTGGRSGLWNNRLDLLRVAVIGYGYWGPNYARLLSGSVKGARLVACVDPAGDRLAGLADQHPQVALLEKHEELLTRELADAAIICT